VELSLVVGKKGELTTVCHFFRVQSELLLLTTIVKIITYLFCNLCCNF